MDPFSKEAYDECFTTRNRYKQHYKDMIYFDMWKYVMEKLFKTDKILDLGCGPGHLANMLYDNGFKTYVGIDFSKVAINMAKNKVPSYTFIEFNLNDINYKEYSDFKFVSTETFEHLENDIELIKKLPKKYIIFSVPNFICSNHYRMYKNEDFINNYYKDVLKIINIKPFPCKTRIRFVIEANIK
jgi:2-polyprenyl-3-methyl-5-hydroxy-6-metoxy-1,4-benzoquinol methylase